MTPAAASPDPVIGTTTNLSVLGADDGGEANLTYTWSVQSKPAGAADPVFSSNGNNAAKNATAAFSRAGGYSLRVTISDGSQSIMSDPVAITVNQTLSSIGLSPAGPTLDNGQTQQFTATARDQFGNAMATQPSFAWSVDADADAADGTITPGGLYTAPAAGTGGDTVRAVGGGLEGISIVAISNSTAPAAPSGLTATTVSASQIDLAWTDNSNNEEGFRIQRLNNATSQWETITELAAGVTGYSHTGLAASTTYRYRVCAFNSGGSNCSGEVEATTAGTGGSDPPVAPSGLQATAVSNTEIQLNWIDQSTLESGYRVYRWNLPLSDSPTSFDLPPDTTTFVSDQLGEGTAYRFVVAAFNEMGSAWSGEVQGNTLPRNAAAPVTAPTGLTILNVSYGSVALDWDDTSSNELGFAIQRRSPGGSVWNEIGMALSGIEMYTDSIGLAPSTSYEYRVVAFNLDNETPSAETVSTTTAAGSVLSTPTLVVEQQLDGRIRLAGWEGLLAPGQSISVFAGLTSNFVANPANQIASDITDGYFEDTQVEEGTTYHYQIALVDANGVSSAPSTSQQGTAADTSPDGPFDDFPPPAAPEPKTYDLVAFYGAGEFKSDPDHPVIWGNKRLEKLVKDLGGTIRSDQDNEEKPYKWTQGRDALRDLLSKHDDGNYVIEQNETPTDVRVLGWSLGAIEAANFTRDLSRARDNVGGWRTSKPGLPNNSFRFFWVPKGGFRLDQRVEIKKLVTFDPVTNAVFGLSRLLNSTKGVKSNVQYFRSYFQTKNEDSVVRWGPDSNSLLRTNSDTHPASFAGSPIANDGVVNSIQYNVNLQYANDEVVRTPYSPRGSLSDGSSYWGGLKGSEVNHSTMVFYAHEIVRDNILS